MTPDTALPPSQVAGINEYFGDKVMLRLDSRQPTGQITIDCPSDAVKAKRAWLRLAFAAPLLEPEEVAFTLNGQSVEVNQPDYIQIPIDPAQIKDKNDVTFSLRDSNARNWLTLRSAVIATEF